jgi:hypothetical protein
MHFPTLLAECDPPAALRQEVEALLAAKALTHELGAAPLSPAVAAFIDTEFELARAVFETGRAWAPEAIVAEAGAFYRSVVDRLEEEKSKV